MTIVIIGGGFAGLSAYDERREEKVVLIYRKDYFLLTPWLIDFICELNNNITVKYNHVTVGELNKIDFKEKKIFLNGHTIAYDKLILALGHHQNLPRLKGAKEFAHKLETLDDALLLKRRLSEVGSVLMQSSYSILNSKIISDFL